VITSLSLPLFADAAPAGPPLRIRHYPRDDSVFIDDEYLIKGVAGAIFSKIANEFVRRGRSEFTTRELRLAGDDLRLPEVQDNLSVRLLLLQRRLMERDGALRIEKTGRGRFRLVTNRRLEFVPVPACSRRSCDAPMARQEGSGGSFGRCGSAAGTEDSASPFNPASRSFP